MNSLKKNMFRLIKSRRNDKKRRKSRVQNKYNKFGTLDMVMDDAAVSDNASRFQSIGGMYTASGMQYIESDATGYGLKFWLTQDFTKQKSWSKKSRSKFITAFMITEDDFNGHFNGDLSTLTVTVKGLEDINDQDIDSAVTIPAKLLSHVDAIEVTNQDDGTKDSIRRIQIQANRLNTPYKKYCIEIEGLTIPDLGLTLPTATRPILGWDWPLPTVTRLLPDSRIAKEFTGEGFKNNDAIVDSSIMGSLKQMISNEGPEFEQ